LAVFTYITLADPGNPGATTPQGINDAGQIVGWYSDVTGTHGFLLSGGTYITLNDPLALNGANTQAYGINDSGQIVGTYVDSNALPRSFLYSGGTYTTIDGPVVNSFPIARGINDAGQIVGSYSDNTGTPSQRRRLHHARPSLDPWQHRGVRHQRYGPGRWVVR
jgi:probable HAF family extracellular repeat protein